MNTKTVKCQGCGAWITQPALLCDNCGDMAKLANARDLKSLAERLLGSIPSIPTNPNQ